MLLKRPSLLKTTNVLFAVQKHLRNRKLHSFHPWYTLYIDFYDILLFFNAFNHQTSQVLLVTISRWTKDGDTAAYDNVAVRIDRNVNVGGVTYALQSYIVYSGNTVKGHYTTYVLDGWFFVFCFFYIFI